jgi:hypothetical protein
MIAAAHAAGRDSLNRSGEPLRHPRTIVRCCGGNSYAQVPTDVFDSARWSFMRNGFGAGSGAAGARGTALASQKPAGTLLASGGDIPICDGRGALDPAAGAKRGRGGVREFVAISTAETPADSGDPTEAEAAG